MHPDIVLQLSMTLLLMFFGALGAGSLPYFINIKESQLNTAGALGGGLLVGTALAVVVPEGFHMFASVAAEAHGHGAHAHHSHEHGHKHEEHEGPSEGLAGLVLVGGFVAMLLIDHMQHAAGGGHHHHAPGGSCGAGKHSGKHSHAPAPGQQQQRGQALPAEPAQLPAKAAARLPEEGSGAGSAGSAGNKAAAAGSSAQQSPEKAILGLIIHCMSDGLAMGVAALSGNARLSALIGMAMVLHKAPMAFGLATYLMTCKWPWQRAQRTLVVFSLTAPASTLATYLLLGAMPMFASSTAVALALLFSGGTFLYAATMHILPEVMSGHGHASKAQLAAVSIGALAPVLLSWGHSH